MSPSMRCEKPLKRVAQPAVDSMAVANAMIAPSRALERSSWLDGSPLSFEPAAADNL